MKGRLFTRPKTEGALNKRFCRHAGIYRSDVSFLLINLGQSTASRSGPGQAIGRAGSNHALPIVHDEFRPAIPQRGARQHGPSPLHRHPQLKSIAASKGIIYHRTVTSLLTVCLSPGGRFNSWVSGYAVFTAANGNSAAVPFGDDLAQDLFLTFNTTGGYGLGVAMASTDFVTLSIVATVYDESGGTVKTINGITIPVGCHMAFDLVQTWGLADMKGTIVFRTSDAYTSPAIGLAVLGIRYNPQGFFTSIPAIEASTLDGSSQ